MRPGENEDRWCEQGWCEVEGGTMKNTLLACLILLSGCAAMDGRWIAPTPRAAIQDCSPETQRLEISATVQGTKYADERTKQGRCVGETKRHSTHVKEKYSLMGHKQSVTYREEDEDYTLYIDERVSVQTNLQENQYTRAYKDQEKSLFFHWNLSYGNRK